MPIGSRHDGFMVIEVIHYDPVWPARFREIQAALHTALDGVPVVSIEHVGSTSVPGLAAKPVIDVDVVVQRADLPAAIPALQHAGYTHRGDLGISDRHSMAEPDPPRRHVYVVVDGSLALRNHLAVRDALRADAELRAIYADLKARLSAEVHDIGDYVERKTEFLTQILSDAGFTEAELQIIRSANQPRR